ncbi:Integrin alpha-3, partial [Thalictrum thalictroides]
MLWPKSLNRQSGASVASANAISSSLPASSFSSKSLVKSLNYVRSLVARHIPKRSFQPANIVGVTPSLSSLLSRSFNSQLSPKSVTIRESPERKEASSLSVSISTAVERVERKEDNDYISTDVLTWRWPGEPQLQLISTDIDGSMKSQDVNIHGFIEFGAAALLVGRMEAKLKGQPSQHSGGRDIPHIDQLLQPLTFTTATNFASAHSHLRVITASKRTKPGPNQV